MSGTQEVLEAANSVIHGCLDVAAEVDTLLSGVTAEMSRQEVLRRYAEIARRCQSTGTAVERAAESLQVTVTTREITCDGITDIGKLPGVDEVGVVLPAGTRTPPVKIIC